MNTDTGSAAWRFAVSALAAGACIGVAAMVYLNLGGLPGCVMFAFGLMTVVYFNLDLFTGRSQFVWGRRKPGRADSMSYGRLAAILLLNIVGCAAVVFISDTRNFAVDPSAIVYKRLADGIFISGLRAVPCGFIMTLSVRAAKGGLWWPLLFGVPTFIICSFPHCIADVFYYTMAMPEIITTATPAQAGTLLAVYLSTVVGNYLGCNIYRAFPQTAAAKS